MDLRALTVGCSIPANLLGWGPSYGSRCEISWLTRQTKKGAEAPSLRSGSFEIPVSATGITAVIIEGVTPQPGFQRQALGNTPALPAEGSVCDLPFRGARAVAMRFGGGDLTTAYAYLPDLDREIVRCTMYARQEGAPEITLEGPAFPFDYTVPLEADAPMEFRFEVELKDGRIEKSPTGRLLFR